MPELASAITKWVEIRQANYQPLPQDSNQLLSDIMHSRLLRRLLAGKEPLPEPPPTSASQPWYELIEDGHGECYEVYEVKPEDALYPGEPALLVNQDSRWRIINKLSDAEYIARHGKTPSRYRVWVSKPDEPYLPRWSIEKIQE